MFRDVLKLRTYQMFMFLLYLLFWNAYFLDKFLHLRKELRASVDLNFGGPELNAGYEMMNDEDYSPTLYGWCQVLIKGKHASSASWNLIPLTISLSAIDSLRKQGK